MYDWLRQNQLNIMLFLCGACAVLIILLLVARFMARRRKAILIMMEAMASLLLWFDRMAYLYAGKEGAEAYLFVRLSNFMVFFLTPAIVLGFNLFLVDWLVCEGKVKTVPVRLKVVTLLSLAGMLLAVISAFTGFYYSFDAANQYHRGSGFLIAYIIPLVCPLIQFTVIQKYRKVFGKLIYLSMLLYVFVPMGCGILQIFAYGISIVNMAMVVVSISLYVFSMLDVNHTVQHAHEIEMQNLHGENRRMQNVFDQMANAFVTAAEKRDGWSKGKAVKTAEYAKRLAALDGKDEETCEQVYYAALLHDVGVIALPDSVLQHEGNPDAQEQELIEQTPLIGKEILSAISEYPHLSVGAAYSHEKYDGSGYPDHLAGEEIPEIARIIAVADTYVEMTTEGRSHVSQPGFVAREAMIKGEGSEFDPKYAMLMVKLLDEESNDQKRMETSGLEETLDCDGYRESVTGGVLVERQVTKITFSCRAEAAEGVYSAPAVLLFDSYDGRVHQDAKTIEGYGYLEYGEIWFDEHSVTTAARKIKETPCDPKEEDGDLYTITAARVEDHVRLRMHSPSYTKEVIVALPGVSKSAYIALTGEHCALREITVKQTGERVSSGDIERIADKITYLDRMESDLKNIQVDRTRSDATEGVAVRSRMKIAFHTRSLPGANLVWHCPYVVLFSSEDGRVNGPGYHEYALVKLNGENEGTFSEAKNRFVMKKTADFKDWETWKKKHLAGLECEVFLERKGNQVQITTENLGIHIENTTTVLEEPGEIYVALTGDQCALTDIRVN